MATKSREIKKALKAAFPNIQFSVTYKHPYGYKVKWENGIVKGATTEAVEAIALDWDTSYREELGGGDCYYGGDSISYEHEILDETWRQFVIECVLSRACSGVYYDDNWNSFKNANGKHSRWDNERYNKWLHNGIKTDLNDHDAICDRDNYYKEQDQQKIDDLLKQEKEYLSQFSVEPEFNKYVGQETENIKVLSVEIILNRPDYRIYNREIIYDIYSETVEKVKPFSEFETDLQFTILDKESGKERKANIDNILNIFDPITPIASSESQIRFINKYNWNGKINNFKYCDRALVQQDCLITEVVKLSPEHYDRFTRQLLNNYEWLAGKGGTDTDIDFGGRNYSELSQPERELFDKNCYSCCLLIFAEGKKAILIDPQGYNYSRYVAFIDNEIATQAISDHEQQHSKKVISLPLPSNQETTITVAPVKQKYLVHYRNWVSGLLSSDRSLSNLR